MVSVPESLSVVRVVHSEGRLKKTDGRQSLQAIFHPKFAQNKKEKPPERLQVLNWVARPAGFEPTTPWFVGMKQHV